LDLTACTECKLVDLPYTNFQLALGKNSLYALAGSGTVPTALISINLKNHQVSIIKEEKFPFPNYLTSPVSIKFPTGKGDVAYGNFYLPLNPDYVTPNDELPPLLIQIHGGPTGSASSSLNLNYQYFSSRGFAVCDVNYRGSTGYGRRFRQSLYKNWGIYDVQDAVSAADYLVKEGKVDGNRVCISGGSAGGFTTLASLVFSTVFKAGVSRYGVSDLTLLAKDTHKFESRYLDNLIGPYPEEEQKYKDLSPINHVEKFSSPLMLFQGDEDEVVPVNQAIVIFEAVKNKGLPVGMEIFKGEQHGFRKAENIRRALDGEFNFYGMIFKIPIPDPLIPPLEIHNLKI
jgi:dipeptidyl aminopeptidase/acylaminoacyl peptidase